MFCREQVGQLRDKIDEIRIRGGELVIIGNGKTLDAGADGYGRGEGVGAVTSRRDERTRPSCFATARGSRVRRGTTSGARADHTPNRGVTAVPHAASGCGEPRGVAGVLRDEPGGGGGGWRRRDGATELRPLSRHARNAPSNATQLNIAPASASASASRDPPAHDAYAFRAPRPGVAPRAVHRRDARCAFMQEPADRGGGGYEREAGRRRPTRRRRVTQTPNQTPTRRNGRPR